MEYIGANYKDAIDSFNCTHTDGIKSIFGLLSINSSIRNTNSMCSNSHRSKRIGTMATGSGVHFAAQIHLKRCGNKAEGWSNKKKV